MTDLAGRWSLSALGAVLCVVVGAAVVRNPEAVALLAPALLGLLALVVLVQVVARAPGVSEALSRRLSAWTVGSFLLHLVVGIAIAKSGAATQFFGSDAGIYHNGAIDILRHWQEGLPVPPLPGGKEGYYYLLAGLYWVFNPHRVTGVVLNATLAAALVPIVFDTTRRLFGISAARYVIPVVVLVPGMVLWTSQLLKEGPIVFLLAVTANCAVRLLERPTPGPLLLIMGSLPALMTLRGPVGFAMGAGTVAGLSLGKRQLAAGAVAGLAVAMVVGLVVAFGFGSSGYQVSVSARLSEVDTLRRNLAVTASSGFAPDADISTTSGAISYLPTGLAGLAFGPFPWVIRGTRQLIAVPDLLAWYGLLPALWRGQRAARRLIGRRLLTVLLPALAITVVLSLLFGNYGTIVPERMQILVLVAPVIGLGLSRRYVSTPQTGPAALSAVR